MTSHQRPTPAKPNPATSGICLLVLVSLFLFLFLSLSPAPVLADDTNSLSPEQAVVILSEIVAGNKVVSSRAIQKIDNQWEKPFVAPLAEIMMLSRDQRTREDILNLLQTRTHKSFGYDGQRWLRWVWRQKIEPMAGYTDFKAWLYHHIDPKFERYFAGSPKLDIDPQEIVWGGVVQDGIPPLRSPAMISTSDAHYLDDDNIIFGFAVNGDVRAYPKRILAWHEMFTDTIGGVPVVGVYCTLCGSMIIYESTIDNTVHDMGTSGFLFRSNKLMYDQATQSLWNTLWGRPVVGSLVGKNIRLKKRSVATTTWGEWRKRHPQTLVLSLDTGYQRNYDEGFAYKDYFATDRLMFTIPERDSRLKNKDEVLGLVFDQAPNAAVAFSIDHLKTHLLIQTVIADLSVVILTDQGGASRVYEGKGVEFIGWDGISTLKDSRDQVWVLTEENLTSENQKLKRLPAHRAFWFGWYAAYQNTELVH